MQRMIRVDLLTQAYPIYLGQQIFSDIAILKKHIVGQQVMIITQNNIADHYLSLLQASLKNYQCDMIYLPDGEAQKNLHEWQKIIDGLVQQGHERSTTLIALGGGIVGDMTGFAAACYQRGVSYIQIPTSLIAQVDASIGGKTAVNHPRAKNMIGAFHQPQCVIIDIAVLNTLPEREYIAGLAEIIKYGLMADETFFCWLESNIDLLLKRDSETLLQAIYESAKIKAGIVAADEKEQGRRSLLNLGHTFGHALEAGSAYKTLLHGEAVAIGMLLAAELSAQIGWIAEADVLRIKNLLIKAGLTPQVLHLPKTDEFIQLMYHDKKVHDGKLHFILLKKIGLAEKTAEVSREDLQAVIEKDRP